MQHDVSTRWGTAQRSDPTDIREHLIVSAIKCFQALGIFQTTIVDVATAASVSSKTVLSQFNGRVALLNGVVVRDLEQLWVQSNEPLKSQATYEDYLIEALVFALDYAQKNPDGLIAFKSEVRPTVAHFVVTDRSYQLHLLNHLRPLLLSRSDIAYHFLDRRISLVCEWFNRLFSSYLVNPPLSIKTSEHYRQLFRDLLPVLRPDK